MPLFIFVARLIVAQIIFFACYFGWAMALLMGADFSKPGLEINATYEKLVPTIALLTAFALIIPVFYTSIGPKERWGNSGRTRLYALALAYLILIVFNISFVFAAIGIYLTGPSYNMSAPNVIPVSNWIGRM